ncbi:hypothetical protein B0J13DRAFT_628648 [Dactylonectria estremocensis]|uniref:GH18 domain-containing protein n=1 Tax=Dactylonectria estremocensis TaxID=1079267 RepID=A0A9P9IJR2_9HYPO|nr:hypothetical protein B0J13DRAFT_628648 [Dactylonectria estremocensis]
MGIAFYGRSFTIYCSSCQEPGCEYLSSGNKERSHPNLFENAAVKAISWDDDRWVSYGDEDTWKLKADFAKSQCLGGILVWAVDYDDGSQSFSNGLAALGNDVNLDIFTGLTLSTTKKTTSDRRNTQDQ